MNIHSVKTSVLLLATLSVLLACALPGLPFPSPVASNPTSDPGSIQTIVVATAGAAQTQTALVLPPPADTSTATLPPSLTPTGTPTATATIIFIIPTKTNTPTATNLPTATGQLPGQSSGTSCELVAQSPANNTAYDSRERFTAEWTIRNTGTEAWQGGSVDFFHSSGRDMHESDILDLPNNVRAGGEVTLKVDMRVPGNSGAYTSTWTLGTQRDALCIVSVTIRVR
jgi:hypothetical protein